jgi:proline dehydrogenase
MLRQLLLYLSTANWARNIASNWFLAKRVARRFVAGESIPEAISAAEQLNNKGILVTLDYLGESVESEADSQEVVQTYQQLLDAIHANAVSASVSVKPTHLGLDISEDLCMTNLRHILTTAQQHNIPITIDMESTAYTDVTIRMYRTLRDEYQFDNVGTVIQAYLYRSEQDMHDLTHEHSHIRLCKGAYLESPELAFPEKSDVDDSYVKLTEQFLTNDDASYLCIATHDENMIQSAKQIINQHNIPKDRYEFQMLYGIRSDRQQELASENEKMRVYVPFGEAWYPYFVRRLAERPANLWFFAKNLFSAS